MFARSLRETELFDHADTHGITVGEAFNEAFALLRQTGLRNEYVYRSALTHNLLLGKHSLRTACMLNEFRIGSCKADLIILNRNWNGLRNKIRKRFLKPSTKPINKLP